MTETELKKINPRRYVDVWEQQAMELFERVYMGQYKRIGNAIKRAENNTLEQYLSQQWRAEPDLVKQAVKQFYDEMAFGSAEQAARMWELPVDWDKANELLFRVSAERAGWFSRAMTETSMRQSQAVVRDWLQTEGGTLGDLVKQMERVWTGPRPLAAAITETTNLVAQSNIAAYKAAGVWGYNVYTMNDDRVRPTHTEVAQNGPYPLEDTEHTPPLFGDINCRCVTAPVREQPE